MNARHGLAVALVCLLTHGAHGQAPPTPKLIRFAAGADSVTLEGGLMRGSRDAYHLDAKAGQQLTVSIKAPAESAVFWLYQPGHVLGISAGPLGITGHALPGTGHGDDARRWSGALPATGRYAVVVVAPGGNASYRLTVTLR